MSRNPHADAGATSASPSWRPRLSCPGCDVVGAALDAQEAAGAARDLMWRLGLSIFFAMNVMMFTMALWSHDVYTDAAEPTRLAATIDGLFRYLTMLFALPVLFLLGGPILNRVRVSLWQGTITTDLLILLGVIAAYLYSFRAVIRGDGHIYFEVGCMVLVFVTLGRWFEANGRQKATESLDALANLLPEKVNVVRASGIEEVPRETVRVGDVLQVFPGDRFAIDGRIVSGRSEVDQQVLTGESRTAIKAVGDAVFSGTLNIDGNLHVEVTAAAGEETISRLLALVQSARDAKGHHALIADRIVAWFVPSICLLSIATGVWHSRTSGVEEGLLAGLAVLLIACPCALGLATPMAIWAALGRAAENLVMFRSGEALEVLAAIRAVRFDKTGTLTNGDTSVAEFVVDSDSDGEAELVTAAALASASRHSFSAAIRRDVGNKTALPQLIDIVTYPGRGIAARRQQHVEMVYLGSQRWMQELGLVIHPKLRGEIALAGAAEAPVACVGWGARVRGVFVFAEHLRAESRAALSDCRKLGLDVAILTGDHRARAARIADILGAEVAAELLPEDKVRAVSAARHEFGRVAMVGDGLNDAPALAAADVGVALGCGADLSRDSASVCLLSDDLHRFPWSISLARQTVAIIHQNLFWAFAYNLVGIGLAVTGRLNPVWAALAMALSSLIVITNSLRLAHFPAPETAPILVPECQTTTAANMVIGNPVSSIASTLGAAS